MGVGANSNRKQKNTLANRKTRAAGRQNTASAERRAIQDAGGIAPMKGKAGGAFGKQGVANRRPGASQGQGGGGGGATPASDLAEVERSSRRTRKS